jgi:hypothetical protein
MTTAEEAKKASDDDEKIARALESGEGTKIVVYVTIVQELPPPPRKITYRWNAAGC